jgi:hypothetical protein
MATVLPTCCTGTAPANWRATSLRSSAIIRTAKPLADFYHVPFHHLSNPKDKRESEREMLELLGQDVDLIVLAR